MKNMLNRKNRQGFFGGTTNFVENSRLSYLNNGFLPKPNLNPFKASYLGLKPAKDSVAHLYCHDPTSTKYEELEEIKRK